MSATSRLARLRALSRRERSVLARALVLLPLVAASLRVLGLRRTQALFLRRDRPGRRPKALSVGDIARLVSIAARRGPFRAKCLPASITLQSLLLQAGTASELRLGVRKRGMRLEAHAWVEHEGVPLMESSDVHSRFSAFDAAIAVSTRTAR